MTRQIITPPGTEVLYDRFHFPQATRVGDLIWVSGQTGRDPSTGRPAVGMSAQARHAFAGVRAALEAAGATMADIVDLTTFHTDLRGELGEFMAVKDEFIPADFPSWTAVGVTQLAAPEYVIEIRAIAVAGCGD